MTKLQVHYPSAVRSSASWICHIIFEEFLSLDCDFVASNESGYSLQLSANRLDMPDIFLSNAQANWLAPETLPVLPLDHWDIALMHLDVPLVDQPLPVLFGKPSVEISNQVIRINVDILGIAFFMLSRYEEAVLPARDEHDRFPSSASIAYRAGFLDRSIVDEYVEVLWVAMKRLWPTIERKVRQPRTAVSCDVDVPYVCGCNSALGLLRRLGGDVIKRRSLLMAWETLANSVRGKKGDFSHDPYLNAIDWMMYVNEKAGNRVAFYFITAHSHPTLDGCYNMDEPVIRYLLRRIAARGHEIGLHTSYNTYQNAAQTCREADILRQVMKEEGIQQELHGGRQHFLRWQTLVTARNWEAAGMVYDSTLSFADRPGFRCGTCHEYPMYDLTERCALKLRQRPLIVMECSVIDKRYMGLGYSPEALELMKSHKRTCHRFGGNFTLLWHNSHFTTLDDKRFYMELIK